MAVRLGGRARTVALFVVIASVASASVALGHRIGSSQAPSRLAVGSVPTILLPTTTTTTLPPTTATTAPAAADHRGPSPSPPCAKAKPTPLVRAAPILAGSIDAFRGFGAWVDVFDWTNEFTNGKPAVGPAAVDRMADLGVQTLYIQAARQESPNDIIEPGLLHPIIDRAHQRGMGVVAWYLPDAGGPGP